MDLPILLAALGTGGAGFASGPALARLAASRTAAQPIALALEEEARLLGFVLADPAAYAKVAVLRAADFARGDHARIWEAIGAVCGRAADGEETLPEHTVLPSAAQLRSALGERLEAPDLDRVAELAAAGPAGDDATLLRVGGKVLDAGADRNERRGAAALSETGDDECPLTRVAAPPTARRIALSRLVLGLGAGASWYLAPFHGGARVLSGLCLVGLVALSVLVSLVDIDTMYLDFRSFWSGAALTWALAAAADVTAHDPRRLLAGVAVSLGIGLFFEGADFCYRRLRGASGMGFGDTLLLFVTVGVPAGLVGSVSLGVDAVFAGLLAGVVGALMHHGAARHRGEQFGRKSPFAFGPYLAAGWFLALGVMSLLGGGVL